MEPDATRSRDHPIEPLTRREREILVLLAGEPSNQEIADHLFLALSSLKWFVGQIYQKLGVNNRRQAVQRARELGLLEGSPAPVASKHNLQTELTSFIGREIEIKQVKNLLSTHRLVTLTGSGGVGKTRLALQVAWQSLDNYKNAAWFVSLAPIFDPDLVLPTVASSLGLHQGVDFRYETDLVNFLK